jgi:DNA-binding response OmpR family regulator
MEQQPVSIEIVAPDPTRRQQCVEAVNKYELHVASADSLEAAMADIVERSSDAARPSLFALVGLGLEATQAAIAELREHRWTAAARILVVDETLTPEQATALLDAGACGCYNKPFLAPMFSARVRGALRSAG